MPSLGDRSHVFDDRGAEMGLDAVVSQKPAGSWVLLFRRPYLPHVCHSILSPRP